MNTTATIAAIATASGAGGIGIVRVSGPHALSLLKTLFHPAGKEKALRPWMLRRGKIVDKDGAVLDDALAVAMPGPKTFTGEDVAAVASEWTGVPVRQITQDGGERLLHLQLGLSIKQLESLLRS